MRILAITNLFLNPLQPNRGTFNRQQLRALAKHHELRVIAPIAWTDELAARRRGGAARLASGRQSLCDGLEVQHPRYLFTPRMLRHWYGHLLRFSIARSFAETVASFRPDVVLAAWAYPDGWAAVELAHRFGLPAVLKIHGSDVLTLARRRGRYQRTAEALRRADRVIAVSQDLATHAVAMGADPERVEVVYDGIDSALFHPGDRTAARCRLKLPDTCPLALFVGNLVPVKGVELLVRACASLRQRGMRIQCRLVGSGPLRAQLEREIRALGVAEQVKLVGAVPHGQLDDWYRAADVFVLPSYSEGVPCVLLEAAACQTPFVATRVGGIPEIAHLNRGMMVPPGNADALADAIATMLSSTHQDPPPPLFARTHADAASEIESVLERAIRSQHRADRCDGRLAIA